MSRTAKRLLLSLGIAAAALIAPSPIRAQQTTAGATNEPASSLPSPAFAAQPLVPSYSPPTPRERLADFTHVATSPYTFLKTVAVAGYTQYENDPPDWGKTASGFGRRVGVEYTRFIVESGSGDLIAAAMHQDVAYHPCDCSSLGHRFRHALLASFTARAGDDGHYTFSPAPIAAPYIAGFSELAWYPPRFGWKDAVRFGSYNFVFDIGGNLTHELFRNKF